jgi:hypothetical protein
MHIIPFVMRLALYSVMELVTLKHCGNITYTSQKQVSVKIIAD